ncbi:MAG TPA: RDD family protein [Opitutaceae bacterium]|nr:RDD family protein [Opitutaceae bacterium]
MKNRFVSSTLRHCRVGATLAGLFAALFVAAEEPGVKPDLQNEPTRAEEPATPEPAVEESGAQHDRQGTPASPASETSPEAPAQPSVPVESVAPAESVPPTAPASPEWTDRGEILSIGNNVLLRENERASKVVVVGGNAEILGRVDGEALVIFGNLSLGERASIHGEAVSIGGRIENPHNVTIRGETFAIGGFLSWLDFRSALDWASDAVWNVRLLSPSVAWPWVVFGTGTLFLFLLAVAFGRGMNACSRSLEERPAATLTTAIALLPGLPLFTILLICTVLGILLLPFLAVAVFFGVAFGKAAMMVFIGRSVLRVAGATDLMDRAWLTILIGAVVLAVLYCVPFLGIFVWALTGWIGLGMVMATLMEKRRREKAVAAAAAAAARSAVPAPSRPAVATAVVAPAPVAFGAADFSAATEPLLPSEPVASAAGGEAASPSASSGFGVPPPAYVPPPPAAAAAQVPVPVPVGPMNRADLWVRLGALLVDIVLIGIAGGTTGVLGLLPFPLLFGAYVCAMWLWKGSTIGGIIFKLQIVRLDGRPVDASTAVVRTLVAFISAATVIGFLWCLWDDEGQTWHDKVAGTNVVVLPKSVSLV